MKVLFVCDARSPTALNWIEHFSQSRHQVHVVSTHSAPIDPKFASFRLYSLGASQLAGDSGLSGRSVRAVLSPRVRAAVRRRFVYLNIASAAKRLAGHIAAVQPDLIHAMRIPFEGILAERALAAFRPTSVRPPLVVSIWGNDFTLHAAADKRVARSTKLVLRAAAGVLADCQRDLDLAVEWGLNRQTLRKVLPGGGGIQPELFHPPDVGRVGEGNRARTVINPRGLRAYVCSQEFLEAIPLVIARFPDARFLCTGTLGDVRAERWVRQLGIETAVELHPTLPRSGMAELFCRSAISVSPTTHDGIPNTLLEALACGCFPIAGDLDSIREWITDGENGLLVNPVDPSEIAAAITRAFLDSDLIARANAANLALITRRAVYPEVMASAVDFYRSILNDRSG